MLRLLTALFVGVLLLAPARVEAGLFKNLMQKVDKTMTDYAEDMFGENGFGMKVWKHEGGFNKTFEDSAAAFNQAGLNAAANLKEVWGAVKDIVLWLPRKVQAAFGKLMTGVKNFVGKLASMNQGATAKERFKNLMGLQGGGGAAQAFSAPAQNFAAPAANAGFADDMGDLDTDELGALLSDDSEGKASLTAEDASEEAPAEMEDVADILAEMDARPSDAPSAPSQGLEDKAAFGKMFRLSSTIAKTPHRKEAHKRIRMVYITTLDKTLQSQDVKTAAALIKSNADLYRGNPQGMQKAMALLAKRHTKYSKSLIRVSKQLAVGSQR